MSDRLLRIQAVQACLPELIRQRHEHLVAERLPVRVVLPKCFNPFEGEDPTTFSHPSMMLGLPVDFEGNQIRVEAGPHA